MWSMTKRVLLFVVLNIAILLSISIILNFFNIAPYLTQNGIDVRALLIFCFVWGMTGACISLALSRIMAKWLMGVVVIDPERAFGMDQFLINTVHKLARNAGLPKMPEVGIYQSPEVNAFATGPTRARSIVAVSSGLLQEMNEAEIEGVLGHEISHIANGDMVTMTLLQGVVNAFVMFFARVLAYAVTRMYRRSDESVLTDSLLLYRILIVVFEIFFMILGTLVIAAFSRAREYRADAGGARLAGRDKMIDALTALSEVYDIHDERKEVPAFQAMKISNPRGILRFFASHPPLEARIARLKGI